MRRAAPEGSKWCERCNVLKPRTAFGESDAPGGLRRTHRYCRECREKKHGICNGPGNKLGQIGPMTYRVCAACEKRKAVTGFLSGHKICRKCEGLTTHGQQYEPEGRLGFDDWMSRVGATEADHSVVRKALARYGRKNPTADEVIEEYCGPEEYTGRPRKSSNLRHAVVLLAHELTRQKGERGRRGPVGPRSSPQTTRDAA